MKSIFIFRRDFRINDNIGLIECCKKSDSILPIFIFTPEQINKNKNKFFSSNSFQFMIQSLNDLNNTLITQFNSKLHIFFGDNTEVLKEIYDKYKYDAIFFNKDYTPYACNRDGKIIDLCNELKINCEIFEDYLLMPVGTFLKKDGEVYQKYTPFKNNAKTFTINRPNTYKIKNFNGKFILNNHLTKYKLDDFDEYYVNNPDLLIEGSRENALNILKNIDSFVNYGNERNDLSTNTTHLSAYIKFGLVSIREVFDKIEKTLGINHVLIDQLIWREFYYYLIYYIPRILENGESLKTQYDNIEWENDKNIFEAWKNGTTGFPGVDAGMREMNKTGFMHNRARLITSGILIKILNCDWRLGEKYFAQMLLDYDPSVNNGNWQWSSGSGADSQPYFRIMSPWKQTLDNDPDCKYIKKWIPELKDVPNKDIHNWNKACEKYKHIKYPKPIVNYENMRKEIVKIYKKGLY